MPFQLCAALSVIAVYFVSVGPVIALDYATIRLGPSVFKSIYYPIFWAHDSGILRAELEWYSLQWGWE